MSVFFSSALHTFGSTMVSILTSPSYLFASSTAFSPPPEFENSTNTTQTLFNETIFNMTQNYNFTNTTYSNYTNTTYSNFTNTTSSSNHTMSHTQEEESSINYQTVALVVSSVALVGWGVYKFYQKKTAPKKILIKTPPPLLPPPPPPESVSISPPPDSPPILLKKIEKEEPVKLKGKNGIALADEICDTIPGLSIISNIIDIVQKIFLIRADEEKLSGYYLHLKQKSWSRCFVSMIPFGFFIANRFKL